MRAIIPPFTLLWFSDGKGAPLKTFDIIKYQKFAQITVMN
jgi:hypothetical protein